MNLFKAKFLLSNIILFPRIIRDLVCISASWCFKNYFLHQNSSNICLLPKFGTVQKSVLPFSFLPHSALLLSFQYCSRMRSKSSSTGQATLGLLHSVAALEETLFYLMQWSARLCAFINRSNPHPSTVWLWGWGELASTVQVRSVAHSVSHNSRQVVKAQDARALVTCVWSGKDTGVSFPCYQPPAEMLRWVANAAFVLAQNSSQPWPHWHYAVLEKYYIYFTV